jgi:hypothetical protein
MDLNHIIPQTTKVKVKIMSSRDLLGDSQNITNVVNGTDTEDERANEKKHS